MAVDGLAGVRTGRGVLHRGHDADGRCHDDGIQVGKNAAADIGVTDAGADADVLAEAGAKQEHLRRVGAGCADINLRGRDMTAGDLRRDAVIAAGQHRADVIRRTGTRIARVAGLPATDHTCAVVGIGPLIDRPQRAVELTRFLTLGVRIRRIVADDDHADGRPDADRRTNPRRHRVGQNFLRARRFDVNDAGRIHVAVAGFRGGLALEHEDVGRGADTDTTGCDRERAGDFLDGDVLGRIHRDRAGRSAAGGCHGRIVDPGDGNIVGDLDVSHAGSGETSSRERSADRIGLEPVDSRCLDVERPGQGDGRLMRGAAALIVEFVTDIGLGAVGADLHQEGGTDRGRAAIGARAIGGSDAGAVLGDDRQRRAGQRAAVHVSLGRGDEDVQPDRRAAEADRDRRRVLLGIGLDRDGADGRRRADHAADGRIDDVGEGSARHRGADDGCAAAGGARRRDDAETESAAVGEAAGGHVDLRRQRGARQTGIDARAVDIGIGRAAHHVDDRIDHDGDAAARSKTGDIGDDRLMRTGDDGKAPHRVLGLAEIGRVVGRRVEVAEVERVRQRAAVDRQRIRRTGSERIDLGTRAADIGRGAAGDVAGHERTGAACRALGDRKRAREHGRGIGVAGNHSDIVGGHHVRAAGDVGRDVGAENTGCERSGEREISAADGNADRDCADRSCRAGADLDVAGRDNFGAGHAGVELIVDLAVDDRETRRVALAGHARECRRRADR